MRLDRHDIGRAQLEVNASHLRKRNDVTRILAPVRFPGCCEVVCAERKVFAIGKIPCHEMCCYIRDQSGRRGRARLIGHDAKLIPFPGEAQDRLEEIAPMRANDPARPKNQMLRERLPNLVAP